MQKRLNKSPFISDKTYTTKRSKPSSYISPQNRTTAPNHHENIQNPIILSKSVDLPLPQESLLLHSRNKKNNPLPKRTLLIHKQAPMSWQKRKAHGKLMQINHIANIDMKQLRQETLLRKYVCHICLRQMRLINEQLCKIMTCKTQKCTYVKKAQKKKKIVHLLQIAQKPIDWKCLK